MSVTDVIQSTWQGLAYRTGHMMGRLMIFQSVVASLTEALTEQQSSNRISASNEANMGF